MKAALLHSPDYLSVEEHPRPMCPDGGVVIRVEACSVCASDVKMWKLGHRDLSYPRVLGHEVAGEVIESKATGIDIGERIQVWPGVSCGHCPACLGGMDNQCPEIGVIGFNIDGGFADYMAIHRGCVRQGGINLLPDGMDPVLASLTEPLACCVNAQDACRVNSKDSVVVFGGGPLGALHLMLAKHRGVKETILFEKNKNRRFLVARKVRPDISLEPSNKIVDVVREVTDGRGADVIIVATSEPLPVAKLIGALAPRGRLSLFSGLPKEVSSLRFDLNELHYQERSLIGSYGCRSSDCRKALGLISSREVDAAWLITKRVPLSGIHEALCHVASREGMKATIVKKG